MALYLAVSVGVNFHPKLPVAFTTVDGAVHERAPVTASSVVGSLKLPLKVDFANVSPTVTAVAVTSSSTTGSTAGIFS